MASLLQQHLAQSSREIGLNPKYLQKVRILQIQRSYADKQQGNMLDIAGGGRSQGLRGDDFEPSQWGRAPLASVDHLMMD
jgi:hypothetical protein